MKEFAELFGFVIVIITILFAYWAMTTRDDYIMSDDTKVDATILPLTREQKIEEIVNEANAKEYFYWRYDYKLTYIKKVEEESVLVNGPLGYGLLVTETPEFPANKVIDAVSTETYKVGSVSVWQITKEEYNRLRQNYVNDLLGATTLVRQDAMVELAKKQQGQPFTMSMQQLNEALSKVGPVLMTRTGEDKAEVQTTATIEVVDDSVPDEAESEDEYVLKFPGA